MNAAVLTCTNPLIRRAQEAKVQRGRLSKSLTSKDKEEAHITREEIERDFQDAVGRCQDPYSDLSRQCRGPIDSGPRAVRPEIQRLGKLRRKPGTREV